MDSALIAYLLTFAVDATGLPAVPIEALPAFQAVTPGHMSNIVCPHTPNACRNLVATFDTEGDRILYLQRLDLDNRTDHSFLLHELVHVLQYHRFGPAIFDGCDALLRTEAQAYRVQNAYLRREGQFLRVGEVLRYTTCAAEVHMTARIPRPEYRWY